MFILFSLFLVSIHCLHFKVEKELIVKNPPWPYAHVCSLAQLDSGELVATWQAGSGEKHPDSAIWTSHKPKNAANWSPPTVAVRDKNVCVMNASLFRNSSDVLHLSFHAGGDKSRPGWCLINSWEPFVTHTAAVGSNGEKSSEWVTPRRLKEPVMGAVKNQCVTLSNNKVLCPSSDEHPWYDTSHFGTTDQSFEHWSVSNNITFTDPYWGTICNSMIQPLIFKPKGWDQGKVFALFRTSCGYTAQAWSDDYGKTWPKKAALTPSPPLKNPGSGIGGTTMEKRPDIGFLLAYNNDTKLRTPLTLSHSSDDGQSWQFLTNLETAPGQFSYPFVIQDRFDANQAYVCYTHKPKQGVHTMAIAKVTFQ